MCTRFFVLTFLRASYIFPNIFKEIFFVELLLASRCVQGFSDFRLNLMKGCLRTVLRIKPNVIQFTKS